MLISQIEEMIVCDKVVAKAENEKNIPANWASRILYLGDKGANNWLCVVNEPNYPLRGEDRFDLHKNRKDAIRGMTLKTLVSLGPGDGRDDIEIIDVFNSSESEIQYIPVDISSELLKLTIANVSPYTDVPIGIQGDFEDGQEFIYQVLSKHAHLPILFSILGGTIGNFDFGESHFFVSFKKLLNDDNYLLFDVPLAGPSWNEEDEPRLDIETYSEGFRRFLNWAVCQWNSTSTEQDLNRNFEKRIGVSLECDNHLKAKTIKIFDKHKSKTILKLRRYDWDSLLYWLQQFGFNIKFSRSSISSDKDKFGMGVVLLANS
jgi:hypothetical protein